MRRVMSAAAGATTKASPSFIKVVPEREREPVTKETLRKVTEETSIDEVAEVARELAEK